MFAIGTTSTNLITLASQDIPAPRFTFQPQTRIVGQNGVGKPVTVGFPTLVWRWDFLHLEQWDYLLSFCASGAASAEVYVRTVAEESDSDGTIVYDEFSAVMWRPTGQMRGGARVGVEVRFTGLVAV